MRRPKKDSALKEGNGGLAGEGNIAAQIRTLRGRRVLLDDELARIYGVGTRALNQATKRNPERFPEDFRFRVTRDELDSSRSQSVILNAKRGSNVKYLPYAYTEHDALMAASVLNSAQAVAMSVYVVRAFVQIRDALGTTRALAARLQELEARVESRLGVHDEAIAAMLSAIRELLRHPEPNRRGIGFTADLFPKAVNP